MAYCGRCGSQIDDHAKFCSDCGAEVPPGAQESGPGQNMADPLERFTHTADNAADFDSADILNNKAMAVLSYLWILVLIPFFGAKNSRYAHYHAVQGMNLFLCELIVSVAYQVLRWFAFGPIRWLLSGAYSILGLLFFVLMVVGIVNAAQGEAKELPIIGSFRIVN